MLKAYALGEKEEVLIGRDDGCDIQISSAISREHCVIERTESGLVLKDLDSSSGTLWTAKRSIPWRCQVAWRLESARPFGFTKPVCENLSNPRHPSD